MSLNNWAILMCLPQCWHFFIVNSVPQLAKWLPTGLLLRLCSLIRKSKCRLVWPTSLTDTRQQAVSVIVNTFWASAIDKTLYKVPSAFLTLPQTFLTIYPSLKNHFYFLRKRDYLDSLFLRQVSVGLLYPVEFKVSFDLVIEFSISSTSG